MFQAARLRAAVFRNRLRGGFYDSRATGRRLWTYLYGASYVHGSNQRRWRLGALCQSALEDNAGNLYGTTELGGEDEGSHRLWLHREPFSRLPRTRQRRFFTPSRAQTENVAPMMTVLTPSAALITDGSGNLYGTTDEKVAIPNAATAAVVGDAELCSRSRPAALNRCSTRSWARAPAPFLAAVFSWARMAIFTAQPAKAGRRNASMAAGSCLSWQPDGTETVLHAFTAGDKDGSSPDANVITDNAGNLYGTTGKGWRNGVFGRRLRHGVQRRRRAARAKVCSSAFKGGKKMAQPSRGPG